MAAKSLKPDIEVVGVQALRFPNMFNAIKHAAMPQGGSTIAEGIAVGAPGRIPQQIIERHVDDLVLVDEGDIEQAIVMLLEIEKTLVEGAGAAGLAALLKYPERFRCRKVGLGLGGGTSISCWRDHRTRQGAGRPAGTISAAARRADRGPPSHRQREAANMTGPSTRAFPAGWQKRRSRNGDPDPRARAHPVVSRAACRGFQRGSNRGNRVVRDGGANQEIAPRADEHHILRPLSSRIVVA